MLATLGYVEPETEEVISCPTEHVTAGSPEVAKLLLLGTPEACQFRSTNQGPPWYATAALTVSARVRSVPRTAEAADAARRHADAARLDVQHLVAREHHLRDPLSVLDPDRRTASGS